ncbi:MULTISPECIES: hypothetical protein [unclassified Anoxybacillus]|uniref:hypothetical protein n=1 Tax=unclassified Anoxybacillus TaxID=2639704 RepID=UPI001EDBDDA4|nr:MULTISPECIES: hypothetical protein [unclassified Anoxybacillus]MCG5024551.1 hypothetical protein [Anoxybacillus flavithermus]MCG6196165.1 hypothetical protein [Anoxybacillus sp. LAT_38]MCG3083382.1 hypothetical protein [Anoxybacillus sp. LAT27]MCG6174403.1 hypothetical protein [Anoxybacillus sp. LAT_31]MCG6179740.1 hypothetical protein [Anoxybacillus sp. LAT_33]
MELLDAYRSLWFNRSLPATESDADDVLLDAIRRDLLDEMTHPRLRKSPYEKFSLALKRIASSSLDAKQQYELVRLYVQQLENLPSR